MATIFVNPQGGAWQNKGVSNVVPYKQKMPVPVPGVEPIEGTARTVGKVEQATTRLRDMFGRAKMPSMPAVGQSLKMGGAPAGVSAALDLASNAPALGADDVGAGTKAKILGTTALRTAGSLVGGAAGGAAGSAVLPGVGTAAGLVGGGIAGNYAGDQAASGFRRLANQVNGSLGGDPNYFTSVEEDLAKVGRDANGSKLTNLNAAPAPAATAPAPLPASTPTTPASVGRAVGDAYYTAPAASTGVRQFKTQGSGTPLFTDQPTESAANNGFRGKGFVGTVGHAGTPEQVAAERERVAGINARADQTNKEIHAMRMAEVHGGNAEDYLPGGARDGGAGQRAADRASTLRDMLSAPDNRVRDRAARMLEQDSQNQTQMQVAQMGLRTASTKSAMSPLEQQKALAEIEDKRASTAKTLAEVAGMPDKNKLEINKALSDDAQATQAQAAKNKTDYVARMKDSFGGDAEEASRFVNAVDQTYAGLVRHLASPDKPESAKVLQRAGIDPSKAAELYASIKDGNGNLLDAYAPGNSLMPFIENGVNRAKKIGKDSWLWKNSERANAFDPYYFDEDATEIARDGLRWNPFSSTADGLYPLR